MRYAAYMAPELQVFPDAVLYAAAVCFDNQRVLQANGFRVLLEFKVQGPGFHVSVVLGP